MNSFFVLAGRMADDFCIDEDAEVAYLTTPTHPRHSTYFRCVYLPLDHQVASALNDNT